MRTYGRVGQTGGLGGTWVEVSTDANGYNSELYLTALIQCLKLSLGESPFFGDFGIPAQQSVTTQIPPDFYVARTQQQWSQFFSALTIQRVQGSFPPQYNVQAVAPTGAILLPTAETAM